MEHFIIILDGFFQKFSGRLIECRGILWISSSRIPSSDSSSFAPSTEKMVATRNFLVGFCCHLLFWIPDNIVLPSERSICKMELKPLIRCFCLIYLVSFGRSHLRNISRRIIICGFYPTMGLLVKMFQYILSYNSEYASRSHHNLFTVDIEPSHLLISSSASTVLI